jgi:hypothetical protein
MPGVLVESCRKADAIRKANAHRLDRVGRQSWREQPGGARTCGCVERAECDVVRDFGVGREQQRPKQRIERVHDGENASPEMRAIATRTSRRLRFAGSDGTIAGPQDPP